MRHDGRAAADKAVARLEVAIVAIHSRSEVEPAARKVVRAWVRDIKFEAVFLCGASFPTRVVAKMVASVVRVTRGMAPPFVFVGSEQEGRAMITEHRRVNSSTSSTDSDDFTPKGRS
jgi:hypothetical protein